MNFLRQINNIPLLTTASVNDHQLEIEYSETCPADAPVTVKAHITAETLVTADAHDIFEAPVTNDDAMKYICDVYIKWFNPISNDLFGARWYWGREQCAHSYQNPC